MFCWFYRIICHFFSNKKIGIIRGNIRNFDFHKLETMNNVVDNAYQ